MLYGLLVTLFVILCFLLIGIILLQKSKSSMGLGGLGGGTQMLFGGSGGQDLFQKATWVMVALFMIGSLTLTLMKSSSRYSVGKSLPQQMPTHSESHSAQEFPAEPAQAPQAPENPAHAAVDNNEQTTDTQTA